MDREHQICNTCFESENKTIHLNECIIQNQIRTHMMAFKLHLLFILHNFELTKQNYRHKMFNYAQTIYSNSLQKK